MAVTALRLSRRALFGGLAALVAAPAIVRVASIMPVRALPPTLSFSEMVAGTLRDHPEAISRNVSTANALMRHLREMRLIEPPDFIPVSHDFAEAYREVTGMSLA